MIEYDLNEPLNYILFVHLNFIVMFHSFCCYECKQMRKRQIENIYVKFGYG